jgi:hypothetical protein
MQLVDLQRFFRPKCTNLHEKDDHPKVVEAWQTVERELLSRAENR